MIAIIDYGVGNLRSVEKAFAATGSDAIISGDERELLKAERLVLPGVGAFANCMRSLKQRGLDKLVRESVGRGTPLLGVCVGMQMLFEVSDEFEESSGLGFVKGRVRRFNDELIVPHVGWNQINQHSGHALFEGIPNDSFFYFVHSYYCEPTDENVVVGETDYGVRYASIVAQGNICGVQFHPEKSQAVGLKLLKNFALNVR